MLCRPHSNIWNHASGDRRAITRDIKWPVKYGQNTARKKHVNQNAPNFFSESKNKSLSNLSIFRHLT